MLTEFRSKKKGFKKKLVKDTESFLNTKIKRQCAREPYENLPENEK